MIKTILFDCDGLIIRHEKYFSVRLAEQKGLKAKDENHEQKAFFQGVFLDCETGKADLKIELAKNLSLWNWDGNVEELMQFWFSGEANVEHSLKEFILNLRNNGFKCFITTNNEKYRCEYLWEVAGLKNIFDGIFASYSIRNFKDEPEFWQKVYQNFSLLNKQEILVWDDDQVNVESAKQFGFNAEFYTSFEDFKKVLTEKYQINND